MPKLYVFLLELGRSNIILQVACFMYLCCMDSSNESYWCGCSEQVPMLVNMGMSPQIHILVMGTWEWDNLWYVCCGHENPSRIDTGHENPSRIDMWESMIVVELVCWMIQNIPWWFAQGSFVLFPPFALDFQLFHTTELCHANVCFNYHLWLSCFCR